MIKLQIVGNLGADCIVKEVNGKNVINFNVAHAEKYKDAQGTLHEKTTWVNCAYWTDRTALAQYLTKGKMVYAEGTPEADAFMNKDNKASATLRMRVLNIQLLGGGDNNSGGNQQQNNAGGSTQQMRQEDIARNNANYKPPVQGGGATQPDLSLDDDLPF